MAASKQLWTPAMYRRLLHASSFLIAGFGIFTLIFVGVMLWTGAYESDAMLIAAGPALASVLCMAGLFKMRGVFRDLVEASPQPTTELLTAAPVVTMEARQPQAVQKIKPEDTREARTLWLQPKQFGSAQPSKRAPVIERKPSEPSWTTQIDWEEFVGKKLLQKFGIVIVLIGMIVFLKYSFDNRWINELGRIALSAVGAGILLACGEIFHQKYAKWSQAFTGGGLALLYLTVWVAHIFYAAALQQKYGIVIPPVFALALYGMITLVGAIAAVRYKSQLIAWFTVLGGYLTPFLIDSPNSSQLMLVAYLAILASGLLVLAWHEKWKYINAAAFALTQLYLFTMVYTAVPEFGDLEQIVTAIGFFILFNLPPLLSQFRLKLKAEPMDIALIILNGLAVFLPVVDALGGFDGRWTGVVCLALAAIYLAFGAAAIGRRGEDAVLVNTYLVGTVVLVAGALLAELEREWVAAGWAPLSVLLVFVSVQLKQNGPWKCAQILLAGALFFLALNLPILQDNQEAIWYPFTSNWALQSYIVFASVIGWMLLLKKLPTQLLSADDAKWTATVLHIILAAVAFLAMNFEASRLVFDIDITLTLAYTVFAVAAIVVFFFTESMVWFLVAILTQFLALLFIFILGDQSGMMYFNSQSVQPVLHPWAYASAFAFLVTLAITYVSQIKKGMVVAAVDMQKLLTGAALAQVWVHVTVEIKHLAATYDWTSLMTDRVTSGWWIAFALAVVAAGCLRNVTMLRRAGMALLVLPFVHDHFAILNGQERVYETVLWTVLSLGLAVAGSRGKWPEIAFGGMTLLALTAGIDMLRHLGDRGTGLVRSTWWALVALMTMVAGFVEREKNLRRLAIILFGATTVKLLIFDFSGLETPVRIGASIGTGLLMIGASYLYQRFDSKTAAVPVSK